MATMLAMTVMGVWIGASIDTYRRFLSVRRPPIWLMFTNDVVFWLLQGLLMFYILLNVNEGEMRMYVFLAVLLGYAAYQSLFQTIFLRWLETTIRCIKTLYRLTVKTVEMFIILPIKWLLQIIFALCMIVVTALWRIVRFLSKLLFIPLTWIGRMIASWIPNHFKERVNRMFTAVHKVSKKVVRWIRRKKG